MKTVFLLLLLVPVFAGAQSKLIITGTVTGLKNGARIALVDINKPTDTVAKARAANGSFVIQKKLTEPMLMRLVYSTDKSSVVFLGNEPVKVKGSLANVAKISITGSKVHNDFMAFQNTFNPLFQKLTSTNKQMQMMGASDSLLNLMSVTTDSIQKQVDRFIQLRATSPVSAFVITATINLEDDILHVESRMNRLTPAAKNNLYGKYLEQAIADGKATAIGGMAADFTQPDTTGAPVSLSSFRGKYVLVDFWASWCGPCRSENPNVVANYQKFKDKNFTILGVSLDRTGQKDRWLKAIQDDGLTWTHVSDLLFWNNAAAQKYHVESIPANFLIGPDGRIVAKDLRGPDLEKKLCEILGCN